MAGPVHIRQVVVEREKVIILAAMLGRAKLPGLQIGQADGGP